MIEEQAVIIDECEGKVYHLNRVGAEIWKSLDGKTSVDEIISRLTEKFEGKEEKIRKDTLRLLNELQRRDMIHTGIW
jgi:hypothetical protein